MNTQQRLDYEENVLGGPAVGILPSTGITGFPGWDYSPKNPRYQSLTPAITCGRSLVAGLDPWHQYKLGRHHVPKRQIHPTEVNASGGNQKL